MTKDSISFQYFTSLLILFYGLGVHGAYYDVLPKGVRNVTYRYVKTQGVGGEFNQYGSLEPFNFKADINADVLTGIDSVIDTFLGGLSAAQLESFSLGKFETNAKASVEAHILGLGYGITSRLTFYAFTPFMKGEVDMNIERTKEGQSGSVSNSDNVAIDNIPEIDAKIIQSLFVNYFGYNELGTWQADDFGDTEIGLMYQMFKRRNRGSKLTIGAVIPTGREDDPNTLQDFGFGDGQWDVFAEIGGGLRVRKWISFDAWLRFNYQLPFTKQIRLPSDNELNVSRDKADAKINYGEEYTGSTQINVHFDSAWTSSLAYLVSYKSYDSYETDDVQSDQALESQSEDYVHSAIFTVSFSTLPFFQKRKFFMPMQFSLIGQKDFSGKNTPQVERIDLEARFFF